MRKTFAAAALAIAAFAGIVAAPAASAAPQDPAAHRQGTAYIPNAKGAVTNWHLAKGSVYGDNLGPGMVDWFTTVYNGSVHESGLDADLKDRLLLGAGFEAAFAPKPIAKIGGAFASRATVLGTFEMRKGVWSFNTTAKFDRVNADAAGYIAPTTESYPTLAVRFGDELKDAGTVMGSPISKAGYVELTGSATKTVNIPEDGTVVTVYGFGYNEDRSDFGSADDTRAAQFTAAANITVARIG